MKNENLCPYCGLVLNPGHRKDLCKEQQFPHTRVVSFGKINLPKEYHKGVYEVITLGKSLLLTTSSAQVIGGVPISGEEYKQNIQNAISMLQRGLSE